MSRDGFVAQSANTDTLKTVGISHAPQPPIVVLHGSRGMLQWTFEGPGWKMLRPTVDFVLALAAVLVAIGGISAAGQPQMTPLLLMPPLIVLLSLVRDVYRTRIRALVLDAVAPIVSAVSVAAMAVWVGGRVIAGVDPSEPAWIRAWAFSLIAVGVGRGTLYTLQRWARSRRMVGKPVLILGAGVVGTQLARRLQSSPEYGLVPVGFLDESPRSVEEAGRRDIPVLGTVDDLDRAVERTSVKNLIVAFSSVADVRVSRLVQRCQELGLKVSVVPRMFETINDRVAYDTVGGIPLLSFSSVDPRGWQFAVKHALDFALAALALIVLSPLLLAIALLVRLTSPGPVLFRQARVGRDGRRFDLYKFRSMREPAPHEDAIAEAFELDSGTAPGGVEGEDRRTPIGRLLRSSSLDELPQLLNVLRGDMSLVGPRPERPEFVEQFRQDIDRYADRHRVKSGITGWAQVHGLRGQSSLTDRVEWDNYYIAHWSLALDLKILLLTAKALFHDAE